MNGNNDAVVKWTWGMYLIIVLMLSLGCTEETTTVPISSDSQPISAEDGGPETNNASVNDDAVTARTDGEKSTGSEATDLGTDKLSENSSAIGAALKIPVLNPSAIEAGPWRYEFVLLRQLIATLSQWIGRRSI